MAPDQVRLPRLIEGLDLRALPIGPAEAFVLSRVDGLSTEAEIASAVGMAPAAVAQTLTRLAELGAVRFEIRSSNPAPRVARTQANGPGHAAPSAIVEQGDGTRQHPAAALYDPKELDEDVELDLGRKRAILEAFYRLDLLNHYELLGVPRTADKRVIRAKYYEVVNIFHPDRYYGKRLGSFKAKLERLFQEVTEAQEVLSRNETRAEYDAYLNAGQHTQALDKQLHDAEAHARELLAVQARIEAEAESAAPPPVPSVMPTDGSSRVNDRSPEAIARVLSSAPPAASSAPPTGSSLLASNTARIEFPKGEGDARRRALARKLGLSSPPPPARPTANAPAIAQQSQKLAAEDLKRRYERRKLDARRRSVAEYEARADDALSSGNLIEAVNALRIASSLIPEDTAFQTRLSDLERDAGRELADRYVAQARYEEREKRWTEAARSYARALSGRPNSQWGERVAHCLLNAGADPRRAVEFARAAVQEVPNDARFRVTLARAYAAAKMRESALSELERAQSLAPADTSIKEQIRRIKRGEF